MSPHSTTYSVNLVVVFAAGLPSKIVTTISGVFLTYGEANKTASRNVLEGNFFSGGRGRSCQFSDANDLCFDIDSNSMDLS
jgi:hypothetical protein